MFSAESQVFFLQLLPGALAKLNVETSPFLSNVKPVCCSIRFDSRIKIKGMLKK